MGGDINGETLYDFSGSSVSLSADSKIVAIGAFFMITLRIMQVMLIFLNIVRMYQIGSSWEMI